MLCLETRIRQKTSHPEIYTSPQTHPEQPPTLPLTQPWLYLSLEWDEILTSHRKKKSNWWIFISYFRESTPCLKISTQHYISHTVGFKKKSLPALFSFSFLQRPGHSSPLLLYVLLFFLLQLEPVRVVWNSNSNASLATSNSSFDDGIAMWGKIQFLCIQAYRLMHPAVIGW